MVIGYTMRSGRVASLSTPEDRGCSSNPRAIATTAAAAACAARQRTRKRGPPILTLSIAIIETITALGAALKPIIAIHAPPLAESSIRLRSSAR
jgi:hypothetical protein